MRCLHLRPTGHIVIWIAILATQAICSKDHHVGKEGDAPTIAHAIKRAVPGDTIHLEAKVYRESAVFHGVKGEPGRPITFDGHGATLEGSDAIAAAHWREVSPSLYANDALLPRLDEAIVSRWFFLWNGRMNSMGRTSKGTKAPLKKPSELQPNEWTFVVDPVRTQPPSKQLFGTFYLKLTPGQALADAGIAAPMRSAGVQLSGENSHLVVRNLTATHVYNDGFNIHGDCREVLFENICAIACGDDGISAHETAEYRVERFVSIGNSTGICDTGSAKTSYDGVFIAECRGYDLFFLDAGRYRLANAVVFSSAQTPFLVTGREAMRCELELDNVLLRRLGPPATATITTTATVRARRVTLENLTFTTHGSLQFENAKQGADVAELLKLVPLGYQQ